MEFKKESVAESVWVSVRVEDGPSWRDSVGNWFQIRTIDLTYSPDGEGNWDTQTEDDVVLSGIGHKGEGWYSANPVGPEFSEMDDNLPWLYKVIDYYTPTGAVRTSETDFEWTTS